MFGGSQRDLEDPGMLPGLAWSLGRDLGLSQTGQEHPWVLLKKVLRFSDRGRRPKPPSKVALCVEELHPLVLCYLDVLLPFPDTHAPREERRGAFLKGQLTFHSRLQTHYQQS